MKKLIFHIFLLSSFVYSTSVKAQRCLDILKADPLYSVSEDIINGTKWIKDIGYVGSPMLEKSYWPKADILYNGIHFRDVHLNYNLFKNELIVFHSEKGSDKYIVINKDHLSGFSFKDSLLKRNRLFEFIELPGMRGKKLYEKIPVDKVPFFIRPMIKFDATPSQSSLGKFSSYNLYYLDAGKGLTTFRSKRQLINLLVNHRMEMNRFIRKQKLKINQKHPEDVITSVKYFDGLN